MDLRRTNSSENFCLGDRMTLGMALNLHRSECLLIKCEMIEAAEHKVDSVSLRMLNDSFQQALIAGRLDP